MESRFEFLEGRFPKIAGYGKKAEKFLRHDNNLSLLNLGRTGEAVRDIISHRAGVQSEELSGLGIVPDDMLMKIEALTDMKAEALAEGYDSEASALRLMDTAEELCRWFADNYTESRFAFLEDLFPSGANVPPLAELAEFGQEAEENLYANTRYCIICLGDIGESIAYMLLTANNIPCEKDQIDRIKMLVSRGIITKQTGNTLHSLRMARNLAIHSRFSLSADGRKLLEESLSLCEWLFRFTMSPGDMIRGRVQGTSDGGTVRVSIGRMHGILPPEEIPDGETLAEGVKRMFRVKASDGEEITLSLREMSADPWGMTARRYEKYSVGQEVNAVIRRLTKTLGAVVVLRDGLEARIPDQELGSNIYNRKKGIRYEVKAKVKWFDPEHYPYMLLSVKDMTEVKRQDCPDGDGTEAMPDSYFMDFCKNAGAGEIAEELRKGANVHAKNKKGMNVLMIASVYNSSPEVVNVLVGKGAKVNAKNYKANTALIFAAMYNTPEVVRALIEKGADVNAVNAEGRKAIHYARNNKNLRGDEDTIALLGNEGEAVSSYARTAKEKKFMELLRSGTDEEVISAVEEGVNINIASKKSRITALMLAAKYRDAGIIREMAARGAGVNIRSRKGDTALITAARYGNNDAVEALLDAGADISAKNRKGESALFWAERNKKLQGGNALRRLGHIETEPEVKPEPEHDEAEQMMKMILQRDFLSICKSGSTEEISEALNAGVNINSMNSRHITALMFAARFNTPEALNMLLEAGADVSLANDKGLTALDFARKNEKLKDTEAFRQLEYLSY